MPIDQESYNQSIQTSHQFRSYLDHCIAQWPELFPKEIDEGYHLHGKRRSQKLSDVQLQRIQLIQPNPEGQKIVLTIKPSGIMPYMTGLTDEVEKALYLAHKYAVPPSCLSYVFGRSDSYWYRQMTHLGRYSLVQTTVQKAEHLPYDLLADEKHSRINREKCYIATTIGEDCILGAAVSTTADQAGLLTAYQTFKDEVTHFSASYLPASVNVDGWSATQNVWRTLFPFIAIIECILHAFISIRSRCKKKHQGRWGEIQEKFWDLYDAPTKDSFTSRLNEFQTWASATLSGTGLKAIQKLKRKEEVFKKWFDHPTARRTSNMLDRHMGSMDRMLEQKRYFHGHLCAAERAIRAWSLAHNFLPYVARAKTHRIWTSPAHKLNQKVYHENWLHNLLVSTSNSPVIITSHQIRQD